MGVTVALTLSNDKVCTKAQLAFCNAGEAAVAAAEASKSLVGNQISQRTIATAAALAQRVIDPDRAGVVQARGVTKDDHHIGAPRNNPVRSHITT